MTAMRALGDLVTSAAPASTSLWQALAPIVGLPFQLPRPLIDCCALGCPPASQRRQHRCQVRCQQPIGHVVRNRRIEFVHADRSSCAVPDDLGSSKRNSDGPCHFSTSQSARSLHRRTRPSRRRRRRRTTMLGVLEHYFGTIAGASANTCSEFGFSPPGPCLRPIEIACGPRTPDRYGAPLRHPSVAPPRVR